MKAVKTEVERKYKIFKYDRLSEKLKKDIKNLNLENAKINRTIF